MFFRATKYRIAALTILVINFHCRAQTDSVQGKVSREIPAKLIVKADLFWPLIEYRGGGTSFLVTIEKPIARRHSIQLSGWYYYYGFKGGNGTDRIWEYKDRLCMVLPEYKFYLSKKRECSGFYAGASTVFMTDYHYDRNKYPASPGTPAADRINEEKALGLGAGPIVGFQYYFFNRLVVDAIAGVIFYDEWDYNTYYEFGGDIIPRIAFNIGYKF